MILQIFENVNGDNREVLIDNMSAFSIHGDCFEYVVNNQSTRLKKVDVEQIWKEVYLLNDSGKTIKRVYKKETALDSLKDVSFKSFDWKE